MEGLTMTTLMMMPSPFLRPHSFRSSPDQHRLLLPSPRQLRSCCSSADDAPLHAPNSTLHQTALPPECSDQASEPQQAVDPDPLLAEAFDPDLQTILSNIHRMQKQHEQLSAQMKGMQSLLAETVSSLGAKGQETRIEALKLRKLAKLHEIEELRRIDDLRMGVLELRRIDDLRKGVLEKERRSREEGNSGDENKVINAANVVAKKPSPRHQTWKTNDSSSNNGLELLASDTSSSSHLIEQPQIVNGEADLHVATLQSRNDEARLEEQGYAQAISEVVANPCVVVHPGALSCTKTVMKANPATKSAVVSMETTVKCDGGACSLAALEADDYVSMAVHSLVETAQQLQKSRSHRARPGHDMVVKLLAHGKIVQSLPMNPPSKFGHESFIVELMDRKSGHKINALFKPEVPGHDKGWHRVPVEWIAYELNLMIGMDYVPPVAYRKGGVDVHFKHYESGAFIYYVLDTKNLKNVSATDWGVSVACLLSDTRILDVLLNNSDRHHGHFLFGKHWATGKKRPILIDHAAGFRKEAVVKMEHENAFQTGPVRRVSAKTYLRLRLLEKQTISNKFEGFLSTEEVNQLMDRRDMILEYLDNLVQAKGYHRTVVEG